MAAYFLSTPGPLGTNAALWSGRHSRPRVPPFARVVFTGGSRVPVANSLASRRGGGVAACERQRIERR